MVGSHSCSHVTQRWFDRDGEEEETLLPSRRGREISREIFREQDLLRSDRLSNRDSSKDKFPLLLSSQRLAAECVCCVSALIGVCVLCVLFSERFSGCYSTYSSPDLSGRFINIHTFNSLLSWGVGDDGAVSLLSPKPPNATFHVEWRDDKWFCLRSMRSLRLVEVKATPTAELDRWTLGLGGYGCNGSAQLFSYRNRAMLSAIGGGYVNLQSSPRSAHGESGARTARDSWYRYARVQIEPVHVTLDQVLDFESRLLNLVSTLEVAARAQSQPTPHAGGAALLTHTLPSAALPAAHATLPPPTALSVDGGGPADARATLDARVAAAKRLTESWHAHGSARRRRRLMAHLRK